MLVARSALEFAEEAGIFTFRAAPNAAFKHFGADGETNVAEGTRILLGVVRKTDSRSSRLTA